MRRYLLAAVVLLIFPPWAEAQTTVSGIVIDESGAALTDAVVTLAGAGVRLTVTTGPIGEYRFANVPPGTYQLTVLLVGFAPGARENVGVGTDEVRLPAVLGLLAQRGIFLPRTGFTYLNLGPTRQRGLELSVDHRISGTLSALANYSWQDAPDILDDPDPLPVTELSLPSTNRFNIGGGYNGERLFGSLAVSYTDGAFWSDVLTPAYHGFTDAYTLVNGSIGAKWAGSRTTTSIKVNNLLNETVQQHVFGDFFRRSVTGEVRFDF